MACCLIKHKHYSTFTLCSFGIYYLKFDFWFKMLVPLCLSQISQFSYMANKKETRGKCTHDWTFIEDKAVWNNTVLRVKREFFSLPRTSFAYITNKDAICIHLWTPFSVSIHVRTASFDTNAPTLQSTVATTRTIDFDIKLTAFCPHSVFVFRIILRIGSDYPPNQNQPVCFCNGYVVCFLWGTNWTIIYNLL
jgi:hypothetical protein